MFTVRLVKRGDTLTYPTPSDKIKYELFIKNLKEGDEVELFVDKVQNQANASQIAKVHTCIRELAKESGYSFEEMKILVKSKAGMCFNSEGKSLCRSFKDISKDEVNLVLEACNEIGLNFGIVFT